MINRAMLHFIIPCLLDNFVKYFDIYFLFKHLKEIMVASAFMKLWTQLLVIMNTHKELECNKYAAIQTFLIIMSLSMSRLLICICPSLLILAESVIFIGSLPLQNKLSNIRKCYAMKG